MSDYNDVIKYLAYVHFVKKANAEEPWISASNVYMPEGSNKLTPLTTFINNLIDELDRLVGDHTNDIAEANKNIKVLSEVAEQQANALKAIQQYQTAHSLGDVFSNILGALWTLHLSRKLKKLSRHPVLTTPIPEWYV
mgnify:CR=1 FL=1